MNRESEDKIIKGYLEYQEKVYFFVFDNWELELLPIEGLQQDWFKFVKSLDMYKNRILDLTSILGYTSEGKAIQFFGFETGMADDGKQYFSVEYYIIGDKYFDDIKTSQLLFYSDIFIKLFPARRGVQIDKDEQTSLTTIYDKIELGEGDEVRLFASSSEHIDLFGEVPFQFKNYIGVSKNGVFSLENCLDWFYALKNSLRVIMNTNNIETFNTRICYKIEIDDKKQYTSYLTLNIKQDEQKCWNSRQKDRWYNILDISLVNLAEKIYKNEIKLDYIINRIHQNRFNQARLIFDFATIENIIKKKQDEYKVKYNDGFDYNNNKFYFRKALLILYREFSCCIKPPLFQIDDALSQIKKIRDEIAHGDVDINISWDMIDYIKYYEKLIYVAILDYCKYPKETIIELAKKVFVK